MTTQRIRPRLTDPVVDKNGRLTSSWEAYFRDLSDRAALDEAVASSEASAAALSEFGWPIFIEYPDDKDYPIVNIPVGFTINDVTTKSTAGTCAVTIKINGVALGGSANSVTTSESTEAHSSDNVVDFGDDLTVTVSSNFGAENVSVMLNCTRTL